MNLQAVTYAFIMQSEFSRLYYSVYVTTFLFLPAQKENEILEVK